jgi:hypothetical protein
MHVIFLDALRREERAARQVERDATAPDGVERTG